VCGERIIDSSAGAVHYRADQPQEERFHDVFHVHKGICQQKAEQHHGSAGRPWHELIGHLNELRRNSGTTFKDLIMKEVGEQGLPPDRFEQIRRLANEISQTLDFTPAYS
jgi:hypothetical protein